MKMWDKCEINWTVLLTIPCVVTVRGSGLCFCTPGFQRGYLPSSSTEPQAVWGGMADLEQSTLLPGYSLHSIYTTSALFLESTHSLMQWGNKSPEAEAAGSFWEQCRTLPVSMLSIPAAPPPRDTSHRQERNLRMLFFQRGESSTGRWGAFPE